MTNGQYSLEFEDIVQRFRRIKERPDTLREVFAKITQRRITYHDFEALKDISFKVPKGQMVGIIGRNGSGKSTLLKVAAGVYVPTAGRVYVHGSIAPLIELGAGFHHELTGRENILLNGLLLGLNRKEVKEREERIVEFAELTDFIDSPIKQYSSGMYMRLAFSVATEVDPDILIIDEILGVGDAGFQEKCYERILSFKKREKTIFFVSHDLGTVKKLCDRAILLHNGEMIADGKPADVVAQYQEIVSHPLALAR